MRYRIKRNTGLLQYPYSIVDKETGHTIDSTITFIGALIVAWKKSKQY